MIRSVAAPTEIFVPELHYPNGYSVEVSDGTFEINREEQTLHFLHATRTNVHTVTVKPT